MKHKTHDQPIPEFDVLSCGARAWSRGVPVGQEAVQLASWAVFSRRPSPSPTHSHVRVLHELERLDGIFRVHCLDKLSETGSGWAFAFDFDLKGHGALEASERENGQLRGTSDA